ncbi:MAG: hypothetical protein WKF62_09640 [Solirubrobacterales bacterium]
MLRSIFDQIYMRGSTSFDHGAAGALVDHLRLEVTRPAYTLDAMSAARAYKQPESR